MKKLILMASLTALVAGLVIFQIFFIRRMEATLAESRDLKVLMQESDRLREEKNNSIAQESEAEVKGEVMAFTTGYNAVEEQTDETPCIAANGANICGRTDVIACPREIPFGTKVEIDKKVYECVDRLHKKYDLRFDIFCGMDFECPLKVSGWKRVIIHK